MSKSARRGFNKVIKTCPQCRARGPKELVEGPKRFNIVPYLLFSLCTCFVGLLFFPLFNKSHLEAYCDECGTSFEP